MKKLFAGDVIFKQHPLGIFREGVAVIALKSYAIVVIAPLFVMRSSA